MADEQAMMAVDPHFDALDPSDTIHKLKVTNRQRAEAIAEMEAAVEVKNAIDHLMSKEGEGTLRLEINNRRSDEVYITLQRSDPLVQKLLEQIREREGNRMSKSYALYEELREKL